VNEGLSCCRSYGFGGEHGVVVGAEAWELSSTTTARRRAKQVSVHGAIAVTVLWVVVCARAEVPQGLKFE